jgi:hypothetical protein
MVEMSKGRDMTVTTLHEVEESLRHVDHETLREMAYQTARSHISVCELTSQVGDCAHISADETRDRVDALTNEQLAALLAPMAWMSIDLHGRIGG